MKLSIPSTVVVTAGFALVTFVGCSRTRETASGPGAADRNAADRSTTVVSTSDRDFASKAAQGGMAEVELGNLAQQRGSNAQIKDFGKKLVEDHTKLNTDLKDIAAKLNLSLPMDVSREQRKTIDKFSKLSGAEFDREFWKDSVGDHRADIDEFRKESDRGENQDLRSFASNSIPTLEDHLRLAENKGMNK